MLLYNLVWMAMEHRRCVSSVFWKVVKGGFPDEESHGNYLSL